MNGWSLGGRRGENLPGGGTGGVGFCEKDPLKNSIVDFKCD